MCVPITALCTSVAHIIAQNRPDNFPSYPPDNHHCSDDVHMREEGYELIAGRYGIIEENVIQYGTTALPWGPGEDLSPNCYLFIFCLVLRLRLSNFYYKCIIGLDILVEHHA